MNKIVNGVANDYEFEMPFEKKFDVKYDKKSLEEYSKKVNEFTSQILSQDLIIKKQQQELDKYKWIIDELILTSLSSSITKEDFEYMWEVAYNKEYNTDDIKEIAERHEILKGE